MGDSGSWIGAGTDPRVSGAVATGVQTVRVTFNEPMKDNAALTTPGNYVITPDGGSVARSVSSVVQESVTDPTYVDLTLDGEMTAGTDNYNVAVSSVEDVAGNPIDVAYDDADFDGQGIVPTVLSAAANESAITKVQVRFSEDVKQVSASNPDDALNPNNYAIAGDTSVTVSSVATISASIVELTVSGQVAGGSYVVTVTSVEDLADNPVESPTNIAAYTIVQQPTLEIIITPSDGSTGIALDKWFTVNARDVEQYSHGIDQSTWQIYIEYLDEGETVRVDVVVDGEMTTYVEGSITGVTNGYPGITATFRVHGNSNWSPLIAYTVTCTVLDNSGYQTTKTATITTGEAVNVCSLDYIWKLIPEEMRRKDADEASDALYKFTELLKSIYGWICEKVEGFDVIRDPLRVRTIYDENYSIKVFTDSVSVENQIVTLDVIDGVANLAEASKGWIFDDGEALFNILAVRKEVTGIVSGDPNFQDPQIDIEGTIYPKLAGTEIEDEDIGDGTGSQTVYTPTLAEIPVAKSTLLIEYEVGVTTFEITDDGNGNLIGAVDAAGNNTIDYVTGDLDFKCETAPDAVTDLLATYNKANTATIRPMGMLSVLAADFGIEIDEHEVAGFQRSSVANVVQWLDLKGSEKSFVIRGLISGFEVTVYPLWAIPESMTGTIPSGHWWKINDQYYTNKKPTLPKFDAIKGDSGLLDTFCWKEPTAFEFSVSSPTPITVNDLGADGWECIPNPATDIGIMLGVGNWMVIDDLCSSEDIGDGDGSEQEFDPTLARDFVAPGTLTITYTSGGSPKTITDDREGGLIGDVDLGGNNTIDYKTGALDFKCSVPPDAATDLLAVYSRQFWIESFVASPPKLYLADYSIGPLVSANQWKLKYSCSEGSPCWFCKTNKLRVEIEPGDILSDPGADIGSALPRMVRKLADVTPAHVELLQIIYKTYVEASVSYTVDLDLSPLSRILAPMRDHFDTYGVPGDT